MARLICPECGLVNLKTARCACGLTALDDSDPANRDAIDEAITLRRERMRPGWLFGLLFAVGGAGFLAGTKLGKDPAVGELVMYAVLILGAVIAELLCRAALPPRWKAAIEYHREATGEAMLARARWTSTTMLAVAICLLFVPIAASGGVGALAYQRGAEPWRIAIAAFTHAGPFHLVGNLIALLAFGLAIDLRVGRIATAIILAGSAVVATLAQAQYADAPMVGFSGAIYGLIGATLALMPRRPTLLTLQGMAIPMPTWLWSLFAIPLFTVTAWAEERGHVAWVAHLAGFAAGFAIGLPMRAIRRSARFERVETRRRERIERAASR